MRETGRMKRGILWLVPAVAAVGLLAGCTSFLPPSPVPGEEPVTIVDDHRGLPAGYSEEEQGFPDSAFVYWDSEEPQRLELVTLGSSSCMSMPVSYTSDGPLLAISTKPSGGPNCTADMATHTWVLETPGSHLPGSGVRVNGSDVPVVDPSTTVSVEIAPTPPREPPPGSAPVDVLGAGTDDPDGRLGGRATSYVVWPGASATLTVVTFGSSSCRAVPVSFDADNTDELDLRVEVPDHPAACSADTAATSTVIAVPPGYATGHGVRLNGRWVNVLR